MTLAELSPQTSELSLCIWVRAAVSPLVLNTPGLSPLAQIQTLTGMDASEVSCRTAQSPQQFLEKRSLRGQRLRAAIGLCGH